MRVAYVDLEHERIVADRKRGSAHALSRARAQARFAEISGQECVVLPYLEVSRKSMTEARASCIVISGSTVDWNDYEAVALAGLVDIIREPFVPILGICAGHQLIGHAYGAAWAPLGPLVDGAPDPDPRFAVGQQKERGYLPVELDRHCHLFSGLGQSEHFFQSHYWHLLDAPDGFLTRARSPLSPIQAIEGRYAMIYGVQFHPERYSADHPAGRSVLFDFFRLSQG